jgi:hypothetical protein
MEMEAQHEAALRRANEVRLWLAEQRRLVKSGRVDLWIELCRSRDERLKSVTVLEFLTWLPGIGKPRARRIIAKSFDLPTSGSEGRSVSRLSRETAERLVLGVRGRGLQVASAA